MTIGLLGKKIGMTRISDERGSVIPVTVIQAGPCPITQIKSAEKDGYTALQLGYEPIAERKVTKPMKGHFKSAGIEPVRVLREFRVDELGDYEVGQALDLDLFEVGDKVDVVGISKGRGFSGSMKRNNASRGPESHGSRYHRRPGSMGPSAYPAHVFKGKKLPGQYGSARITMQNLTVVKIDKENNLLVLKGSVPGHNNSYLSVQKSIKLARKAKAAS